MTGPPKSQEELKKEQQQELIRQQVYSIFRFNDLNNRKNISKRDRFGRTKSNMHFYTQVEQEHEEQMRQLKQRKKKQATPPPPPKTITVMAGKFGVIANLIQSRIKC